MRIREAASRDREEIRSVHRSAFPEGEREIVSKLAVDLLLEVVTPRVISLVAEAEGSVVGHAAFSPVAIDDSQNFQGYILAPLGVKPAYQKRRIGSQLIENGFLQLSEIGVDILFVYGDPGYYSRFGFSVDAAERFVPPQKLQHPLGWQGICLRERSTGKKPVKIACVTSLCDPVLW